MWNRIPVLPNTPDVPRTDPSSPPRGKQGIHVGIVAETPFDEVSGAAFTCLIVFGAKYVRMILKSSEPCLPPRRYLVLRDPSNVDSRPAHGVLPLNEAATDGEANKRDKNKQNRRSQRYAGSGVVRPAPGHGVRHCSGDHRQRQGGDPVDPSEERNQAEKKEEGGEHAGATTN